MTDFLTADMRTSIEFDNGGYIDLKGEIAQFEPSIEAQLDEQYVEGRSFPVVTYTGLTGGITITGLRTDTAGVDVYEEVNENSRRTAFFACMNTSSMFMGPVGKIMVKNNKIVGENGVFRINGENAALPADNFTNFRYGTLVPTGTVNTSRNQGSNGFPAPVGNQIAIIDVVKPGALTQLEIQLIKSSNVYKLAAKENAGSVVAGITRGPMLRGTNRVPGTSLTGYQWRIVTSGSVANTEFYIGLVHLFA